MKNFKCSLFLIGSFFLATSFAPVKKGFKYVSDEGKMCVVFPTSYEIVENEIESGKTVKISAADGDRNFLASYSLHNIDLDDPESLAEVSLNTFNEQMGGEIVEQSEWVIKGSKGLKSVINMEAQNVKVQYWVVLRGRLQYQLVAFGPASEWDQAAFDKFFKSFKVK